MTATRDNEHVFDIARRPVVRVSGVLVEDGRILMVEQARAGERYWLLPGGGVSIWDLYISSKRTTISLACSRLSLDAATAISTPKLASIGVMVSVKMAFAGKGVWIDGAPEVIAQSTYAAAS